MASKYLYIQCIYQTRHELRNNARRCLRRTTLARITFDLTWNPSGTRN